MVNISNFCDPNFPQNFCTLFDSISHSTCSAMHGSPLTCGNDMAVAGFLTNVEGCSTNAGRTILNYHSVHDFHDWIEGVFGPELPERDPVNFIVTVMEFTPPSTAGAIPRCFGTIITSSRVLTSASCATTESPLELLVQTRIVQGLSSSSTNCEEFSVEIFDWHEINYFPNYLGRASRIYIYPYYRQENPFVNNVAIIEVTVWINLKLFFPFLNRFFPGWWDIWPTNRSSITWKSPTKQLMPIIRLGSYRYKIHARRCNNCEWTPKLWS